MAGFGRTGRWFACEHWDVVPDIITVAKGINSGYVPLGAMVVREPIADWVRDKFFAGGLTYSGHPLACATAVASIEAFREEGIVENAAEMGERIRRSRCAELAERHPSIGDVRGLGCFWGLELVQEPRDARAARPVQRDRRGRERRWRARKAALERGLYLMTHWNVVMVCPPLTITREELDEGIGDPRRGARGRRRAGRLVAPGRLAARASRRRFRKAGELRRPAVSQPAQRPRRTRPVRSGGIGSRATSRRPFQWKRTMAPPPVGQHSGSCGR